MIRRTIFSVGGLTAAAVIGGLLVFGTDLWSYASTFGHSARQSVKSQVPLEFEMERARKMVGDLLPDIRQNMHTIAEEEVEVAHLRAAITRSEDTLAEQKQEILALRQELNEPRETYQFAGRSFTSHQVRQDLARRFDRYQTAEATLGSKRQMLDAREKSLAAARDKLDAMIAAKRELEVEVEHLAARLKLVQAAQASATVQFDNSRLARAKDLVNDLQKRLDVAQRLIDAEGEFTGEIPLGEPVPENIAAQVDEYFGQTGKASGVPTEQAGAI